VVTWCVFPACKHCSSRLFLLLLAWRLCLNAPGWNALIL
jgi:hypothetical protein